MTPSAPRGGPPQLRWTEAAADDLEGIVDYLAEHAPIAAARVARALYAAAADLTRWPHRGRQGRRPGTRESVVASLPYVIVYQVAEGAVTIARILDARRDLDALL